MGHRVSPSLLSVVTSCLWKNGKSGEDNCFDSEHELTEGEAIKKERSENKTGGISGHL